MLESKKRLKAIEKKTVTVILVFSLGSIYYQSAKIFLGVFLGGILSLINIKILSRIIENLFQQEIPNKSAIIVQYSVKVILLLGILYLVITYNLINSIAFVVGFSAFFIALILSRL